MPRFPASLRCWYLLRDYELWAHKAGHVIFARRDCFATTVGDGTVRQYDANGGVTPDVSNQNSHDMSSSLN